jgi:general stress protein 26
MLRRSFALSMLVLIPVVPRLEARAQGVQPAAPSRAAVVAAARTVIAKARYATFTTLDDRGGPQARIVDPFAPEDELTIWVATNSRSRKVGQIARDGRVTLTYFDRGAEQYVTIVGAATIVRDLQARETHWKEEWKAFYQNGFRGDDYLLIRIEPIQLEVVAPGLGMNNDPVTWRPVTIEMRQKG